MDITMPRGDLRNEHFTIKDKNGDIVDIVFDNIYFSVKKKTSDANLLFQKKLSDNSIVRELDGSYSFRIEPEDTDNLKYGTYVCDIEIVKEGAIKQTFMGRLVLTDEVTHHVNEVEGG